MRGFPVSLGASYTNLYCFEQAALEYIFKRRVWGRGGMYKQTLPESDNYNYTTGISYQLHGGEWPTPPCSCSGVQQHWYQTATLKSLTAWYLEALLSCIMQALANNTIIDRPVLVGPASSIVKHFDLLSDFAQQDKVWCKRKRSTFPSRSFWTSPSHPDNSLRKNVPC